MRRGVILGTVLLIAGCDERPTVPMPADTVPTAAQHHGDTLAAVGPAEVASIFVYDTNITDGSPGAFHDGPRLYIAAGHATDQGYVADGVVLGEHIPGSVFTSAHTALVSPCTGTATYAEETWTIALGGGAACEHWNGVFRARPPWVDSWDDPRLHPPTAPAEPHVPPALTILLPPPTTPFARALAGIDAMAPGDAPCPVSLHAPDAEIATGATPGEAALRHADDRDGERFEVMHAESGTTLPSAPASALRYQALFVRTEHREPSVIDDTSFTAGLSRGRAFLVDTSEGRVVCVGDVLATNGAAMTASSERSAAMWLTLQLAIAEERAIALGLRAPASSE